MIDFSTLTDREIDAQRVAVLTEQERRVKLTSIPHQVKDLANQYEAGGGSRQALLNAITTEE